MASYEYKVYDLTGVWIDYGIYYGFHIVYVNDSCLTLVVVM